MKEQFNKILCAHVWYLLVFDVYDSEQKINNSYFKLITLQIYINFACLRTNITTATTWNITDCIGIKILKQNMAMAIWSVNTVV